MQNLNSRYELMSHQEMKDRYDIEYPSYQVDLESVDKIKVLLKDIRITVVLGTWCGDSQLQVPHFFKIMDQVGVSEDAINLICVDRTKIAQDGSTDNLNITQVPTFILMENDLEIGRITESPNTTLENDIIIILANK